MNSKPVQKNVHKLPTKLASILSEFLLSTISKMLKTGVPKTLRPGQVQRPKNAGGRVALPPERFGSIRKILDHGLLKTSLEKGLYSPRYVRTVQNVSGQPKICLDSPKYVRTAQNMSGQPKICPDSPTSVLKCIFLREAFTYLLLG